MSAESIKEGGICVIDGGLAWEYISKDENDFLFHEIFIASAYFKYDIDICDGDVIVDLGANIGLFSLYCQSLAEDLHLIAVEPIQPIFDVLRRNLSIFENVALVHGAIGNPLEVGHTDIFLYCNHSPGESTRNTSELSDMKTILNSSIQSLPGELEILSKDVTFEVDKLSSFSCPMYTLAEIIKKLNLSCIDLLKVYRCIY